MKKIYYYLTIILSLFLTTKVVGQARDEYTQAYKYIKKQFPHNKIVVAPTVGPFEIFSYANSLSVYWKQNIKRIKDTLFKMENKYDLPDSVKLPKSIVCHLHPSGKGIIQLVYFSNVYQDMLIAWIVQKSGNRKLTYTQQASQKELDQLLFLFDEKHHLKKAFSVIVEKD